MRGTELTVRQVADRFGVSLHVVYYWIDRGILAARQDRPNRPYWIALTDEQTTALTRWVQESQRIMPAHRSAATSPTPIDEGAL